MNVVNMAANQILTAFFYALIPVADSLSQTAQALLPPLFVDTTDPTTATPQSIDRLRRALQSFGKAALLCGAGLVTIVSLIPTLTRFIMTTDPAVQSVVNSVVPIHVMIFLFHGVFCASEGILLAQKDLAFLGKMYGIYFAIVPALILQLQRLGPHLQLHHVWYAFMAYQFFRISAWVGRVYFLFRKRKNRASST
jgi:Na+-driven multidrug efflux pump